MMTIERDSKITLYFSLALQNGSMVDSNFELEPATFTFGDGSLLPAFENVLLGLKTGEEKTFLIDAADAFGGVLDDNIHQFPISDFPDLDIELGLMINFADASKSEVTGVVKHIEGDRVTIDFNHPLAGHDITFKVHIVDVQVGDSFAVKQL